MHLITKNLGCMKGEMGVAEGLPGDEDEVGLFIVHNCRCLFRSGDQAHSACGNTGLPAYPFGEWHLVSWSDMDLLVVYGTAGGAVDQVHAKCFQPDGKLNGLVNVPSALCPIRAGNSNDQR